MCDFVREWDPGVDVIVPAPPSRDRPVQPLYQIADRVGQLFGCPVDRTSLRKTRITPEMKNVDYDPKRFELLRGAHSIEGDALRRRRVLLLDDLYRSGATLNAVASLLKEEGGVSAVFALALTRTRS